MSHEISTPFNFEKQQVNTEELLRKSLEKPPERPATLSVARGASFRNLVDQMIGAKQGEANGKSNLVISEPKLVSETTTPVKTKSESEPKVISDTTPPPKPKTETKATVTPPKIENTPKAGKKSKLIYIVK